MPTRHDHARPRFTPTIAATLIAFSIGHPTGARADGSPPSLVAQHVMVGDPIQGLDTIAGTLFSILPDDKTPMASTTKIWTLDLVLHAVDDGVVHLSDQVTVSALAASVGGSSMNDIFNTPLQQGEIVLFADLLRGMMYPSGNNAAWAVAEHVAQGYWGANAGITQFVALMNSHAQAQGLTNTHFTSPNGFDSGSPYPGTHYTTPRELAKMWLHAFSGHAYFGTVTGFIGNYNFTTTVPPNTTRFYSYNWGSNYPGWQGAKGGATTWCNGPNKACIITSARRIGRQVIVSEMQADPANEQTPLFDWGFNQLFNPAPRGQSALGGPDDVTHAISCMDNGRAAVAALGYDDQPHLLTWNVNVDQSSESIATVGPTPLPAPGLVYRGARDIQMARLSDFDLITATRIDTALTLDWFHIATINASPAISDEVSMGTGKDVALARLSTTRFASLVVNDAGQIVTTVWTTTGGRGVGLAALSSTINSDTNWGEVSAAATSRADFNGNLHIVGVARSANSGNAAIFTWLVTPSGAVTQVDKRNIGPFALMEVSEIPVETSDGELFPPMFFAVAGTLGNGNLEMFYEYLGMDGTHQAAGTTGDSGIYTVSLSLAPFGSSGLVTALRSSTGAEKLVVWESRRATPAETITGYPIVTHTDALRTSIVACTLATHPHSEGDLVTASRVNGKLVLQGFRTGPHP